MNNKLREALENAVKIIEDDIKLIRGWHGMGMPNDQEEMMWEIYSQQAPEMRKLNSELEQAKSALSEKEDGWVDVNDRLPELGGRYWCYVQEVGDLGISGFQWNCCYHDDTKSWTDNFVNMHVTHWRPLPLPPTKTNQP